MQREEGKDSLLSRQAELAKERCRLRASGFSPIPVIGKRPPMEGWTTKFDTADDEIGLWDQLYPLALNTGILCKFTPTLDIDILDPEAAEAIEMLARERFEEGGYILVRVGQAPKRAIPFRTQEPFRKIAVTLIAPNGSGDQKIEFLGDGQQVVAFGIHEKTREPYRWHRGEPGEIGHDDLPYIRESEARQLIEDATELLCRGHGYCRAEARPKPENGDERGAADWSYLIENIRDGRELHDSLRDLAAKLTASGMGGGAAVNFLRATLQTSTAARDARWQQRFEDITRLVSSAREKQQKKLRRFQLEPFDAITLPTTPNYLVKGIIPRGGMTVIWGPPKCGKSFWTFDLAMHIALGRPYRGRRVSPGAVVYLALEGGGGFRTRIEAWRRSNEVEPGVPFYLLATPVDLVAEHEQLIAAIRAQVENPEAVVIDTLNRALTGNENDAADMARFIRAADAIRALGCAVLIVHHSGIAGGRPRGHTSLPGADDAQIAIEHDDATGVIGARVEHMKDGQAGATVVSRLLSIDLGLDDDGDSITSCVIVPAEGVARRKVKLSDNVQLALDALRRALTDHAEEPPTSNYIPQQPDIRVCPVEIFRRYFYELKIGEPDTKLKAFVRAVDKLLSLHIIGKHGDFVWLTDMPDKAGQA